MHKYKNQPENERHTDKIHNEWTSEQQQKKSGEEPDGRNGRIRRECKKSVKYAMT